MQNYLRNLKSHLNFQISTKYYESISLPNVDITGKSKVKSQTIFVFPFFPSEQGNCQV